MRGQNALRDETAERSHRFGALAFFGAGGLAEAAVFSLLVHIALAGFLILGLKAGATRTVASFYRVTVLPVTPAEKVVEKLPASNPPRRSPRSLPLRPEPPVEEDRKSTAEVREREPIVERTVVPPPEVKKVYTRELQQVPEDRREEKAVTPIPLPVAFVSASNRDPETTVPHFEAPSTNSLPETNTRGGGTGGGVSKAGGAGGDGPGAGGGGPGGDDSGNGTGTGQGATRWIGFARGVEKGPSGSGRGGSEDGGESGRGGAGKGTGSGGEGAGNRDGTGQGEGPGNGGILAPYARSGENKKPIYPQEARTKGYRGEVILRVEVLPNGRAGQIEVKQSSGHEALDRSALAAVKEWRFVPARKGDVPVPFWVNIPIKFQLS